MLGAVKCAMLALMIAAMTMTAMTMTAMTSFADVQMASKAIDARRSLMKNMSKNIKVVASFVKKGKGTTEDVARSARMIASDIARFPNYYPKGTAQGSAAGNTRPKAEIWTRWTQCTGTAAKAAGIDFTELCWRILETSISDQSAITYIEKTPNDA